MRIIRTVTLVFTLFNLLNMFKCNCFEYAIDRFLCILYLNPCDFIIVCVSLIHVLIICAYMIDNAKDSVYLRDPS
jgi:hypothetical protein